LYPGTNGTSEVPVLGEFTYTMFLDNFGFWTNVTPDLETHKKKKEIFKAPDF
jgi:hypothetical protein